MPHHPGEMNEKRAKLLTGLSKGMNLAEAGRTAGYTTRQAANNAFNRMKSGASKSLERVGLPIDKVLRNLKELTVAKKTERITHQGIVMSTYEDPDNAIRLEANKTALRIHDAFPRPETYETPTETTGVSFDLVITDPEVAKEFVARLAEHRARRGEQLVMDEAYDEDEGRAGPDEPL